MIKYMVRTDLEGISGIVSYMQAEPRREEYTTGQKYFMSDLNALLLGLLDGGADEIYLYDEHCHGRNIDLSRLPEKVYVYMGKPPYSRTWAGGLEKDFSGLILLGSHAKAGSTGRLLNHTYEADIKDILLNGVSVGEIGMETAIAGELGVPLVLLTGDSAGVAEARKLVPDVVGVEVKKSLSEFSAVCLPLHVTSKMIYESAKKMVMERKKISAFCIKGPVTMEIKFHETEYANNYLKKFPGGIFHDETVLACWANYLAQKGQV